MQVKANCENTQCVSEGPGPLGPAGPGARTHCPGVPPSLPLVSDLTLYMFNSGKVFIILNYYCFEINGRLSSFAALHDLWRDGVEPLSWGPGCVDRPCSPP